MSANAAQGDTQKSKYSAARHVGRIRIPKIRDQLLEVLKREAKRLLDESHKGRLTEKSSESLIKYLKLIKDLSKQKPDEPPKPKGDGGDESEPFTDLTDEELKKLAAKPK